MKKPAPDRAATDEAADNLSDDSAAFVAADESGTPGAAGADNSAVPGDETGTEGGAGTDAGADQEITALARELGVQKDKYLRLLADYENFRRRSVRERQEAEQKGMGHLIKGILDTLDDLGRFAHLDPASTDTKTVVEGVELVERKILKSLAGHGLEIVNPVNEAFDPAFQEALTTVPAATKDEDHLVAQVYQVGYVFNGQLLRPARVVVKQWQDATDAGQVS